MKAEKVIAIFDIGKTNKKFFLFNKSLKIVFSNEKIFPIIKDDDGFECDDFDYIETWMDDLLLDVIQNKAFDLQAVNVSAYGSTIVYVNEKGRKTAPVYNYLKNMPADIPESLYARFGGKAEFLRVTASPELGGENCGHQILWLKRYKFNYFNKTKWALFLAQYLTFRYNNKPCSELTSFGCHTGIWNYDKKKLHEWAIEEKIDILIPELVPTDHLYEVELFGKKIKVGVGIHDSSASLAPYLFSQNLPFVLISSGTWCINMNPFNHTTLSAAELKEGCLNYISVMQKPVKSSRLFLGRIHDLNVVQLARSYNVDVDYYKTVSPNIEFVKKLLVENKVEKLFFPSRIPERNISEFNAKQRFSSFDEAYHQFLLELALMNHKLLELIMKEGSEIREVYISGGFANNKLFTKLVATLLPGKIVYVSDIANASALGAAMMVYKVFNKTVPKLKIKRQKIPPFEID